MLCCACIFVIASGIIAWEKRKQEEQNCDLSRSQFATLVMVLTVLVILLARAMLKKQLQVLTSAEHSILGELSAYNC